MKVYVVKSVDTVANLVLLTISGDGQGLKNGATIIDENLNTFIIESIAMPSGKSTVSDETILNVRIVTQNSPIGRELRVA